ncbi:MAG: hypothetical protein GXP36_01435 [Actinobacteria bacterium]|nr:hypothetical protein [Actinomycetota bacterium]
MRVDEEAGQEVSDQAGSAQTLGSTRTFAAFLPAVAFVLGVVAVYFAARGVDILASTCWEDRWYEGCQENGVGKAFGPLLVAQVLGAVGIAVGWRASRSLRGHRVGNGELSPDSRPRVTGGVRFSLGVVASVLLFGAGVLSLLFGFFVIAFTCWSWQDSSISCTVGDAVYGSAFVVLGEVLWVAGFLVVRRAFRRRPWRHDAQRERPET